MANQERDELEQRQGEGYTAYEDRLRAEGLEGEEFEERLANATGDESGNDDPSNQPQGNELGDNTGDSSQAPTQQDQGADEDR